MDSKILEILLSAAVPAITALLLWLVSKLIKFFDTKVNEIKTRVKNETLVKYIDIVAINAKNIVMSLNQTMVEDLKAAASDGKLTKEDALNIKTKALTLLTNTVSEDMKQVLEESFGDLHAYLDTLIEKTVAEVKKIA